MTVILGEPDTEYHASGAIGSSMLKSMLQNGPMYCDEHYVSRTAPVRETPHHFYFGRAVHCYALEGEEEFHKRFIIRPDQQPGAPGKKWHGGAKACKEWLTRAALDGKQVLSSDDFEAIKRMRESLYECPEIAEILATGCPEVTIRNEDELTDLPIQIRIDWLHGDPESPLTWNAMLDVKTCEDLNKFERDLYTFGYHVQAAFYQHVASMECGETLPFRFAAIEKQAPYRCGLWYVPDDALDAGRSAFGRALDMWKACADAGEWPRGSRVGLQCAYPPAYILKREEAAA